MKLVSSLFAIVVIAGCHEQAEPAATVAPDQPKPVLANTATDPQPAAAANNDSPAPRIAPAPGAKELPAIPEDPAAAKRANAQWDQHLDREEEERQMSFDKPRLAKHRAIVRSFKAIRAKYDAAKNAAAVAKAREAAGKQIEQIDRQLKTLDPWGNNSRLLPDYAALKESFAHEYPDAKLAALGGDKAASDAAREKVEQHFEVIGEWLEEAEHGGDEEEEHEREERRERTANH